VVLTIALGYFFAIPLPGLIGLDQRWGAAGLTVSAGLAGWVEFSLLRRAINQRIGKTGIPRALMVRLWVAAAAAAIAGAVVKLALQSQHPVIVALFSLGIYGIAYFAVTAELGIPESRRVLARVPWFRS
jgi:putative peptidoglycan lipid II flippase